MIKFGFLTLAIAIASPVIAQATSQNTNISDVAPKLPLVPVGELVPEPRQAEKTQPEPNLIQSKWISLEDTQRYLLIMGTADGFSAAGPSAPCFLGKDNAALDTDLKAQGFGDKDPTTLAKALVELSGNKEKCAGIQKRGYNLGLLKSMPDQHLAMYLTGAVRGFAEIKPCDASNHPYAAATATAAIFTADANEEPSKVLRAAFEEGCLGVPNT